MDDYRTRIRPLDEDCPLCGSYLVLRMIGEVLPGHAEPVNWRDDERFCPRGCGSLGFGLSRERREN